MYVEERTGVIGVYGIIWCVVVIVTICAIDYL